jgi:hypothetical protein
LCEYVDLWSGKRRLIPIALPPHVLRRAEPLHGLRSFFGRTDCLRPFLKGQICLRD